MENNYENMSKYYSNLYDEKMEKFRLLFKEMLNFLNIKYEKEDFSTLKSLVYENYPYYTQIIINITTKLGDINLTYKEILDSLDNIYKYISKNYRNHEQNMKDYIKEQEDMEALGDNFLPEDGEEEN